MARNLYAFRDDVKARAGLPDTDDDSIIDPVLQAVSREIDSWCGRHFYAVLQTRYYTPRLTTGLLLPNGHDLLSVTTLKTDTAGDRTYATNWAATDYDLEPSGAPYQSPPAPFWKIDRVSGGDYAFGTAARNVQIAGRWGYYDVLETSTSTLAEALDTSETTVDVSNAAAFKVGQIIEIDSERMEISACTVNTAPTEDTLTVERAVNGTTAAAHDSGAAIRVATYPIIGEAALHQALLLFRGSTSAPLGVQGSPEYGQQIRASGLHPFVRNMLVPFKIPAIG